MVKCAKENKIILLALAICLFFTLTISTGCKKKEQSEQARQDVSAEKTKNISASGPTDMTEKIDLRILYAGQLDTDRAKDFVNFLSKHFKQVETSEYKTFTGDEAADFDVAVIDHDGLDTRAPRPKVSRQYTGATVTMGVPGAFICSNLSLKTGYL
ncbi:MAG: hypothetical protein RQ760_14605 [Sedimentisphaerales bacterium]|nr:hypothetical protein [Sedimentisphaerales bacterium]